MPARTVETILLRFHGGKKSVQRNPSSTEYRAFFQAIDSTIVLRNLIRRDLSLADDLARLTKKISTYLVIKKKTPLRILLLELLDQNVGVSDYDDYCFAVHGALRNPRSSNPCCIVITVANPVDFKLSESLKRQLKPFCERKGIALLLLGWGRESDNEILSRGKVLRVQKLPQLRRDNGGQERGRLEVKRSSLDIERKFDILFGHFEIEAYGKKHHVPAVASLKKLVDDEVFIHQLDDKIAQTLNNQVYQVLPFGIRLGGIDDLSLKLVEGDSGRQLQRENLSNLRQDSSVVLLCDFISPVYPLQDTCNELRSGGAKDLMIAGIGSYNDAPHIRDVQTLQFVRTNYRAAPKDGDCAFCNQGVPLIQGEDYERFARQIRAFDSFTFWELIRENPDYYLAGHWASDKTLNHYQFRIMVKPLLIRH